MGHKTTRFDIIYSLGGKFQERHLLKNGWKQADENKLMKNCLQMWGPAVLGHIK